MRKLIAVGALAALATVVLAVPASASFDPNFSVLAKQTSGHRTHKGFRFKDHLLNPSNRHDRVGRDWGNCRFKQSIKKLRCRATVHLNGDIGGFGDIKVSGDLGRHDHRVNVVGGTHDFVGVAGKMKIHSVTRKIDQLSFSLVR
jgi:hypothetical protein